ncbi:MAG: hypothetical protein KGO92_04250 [Bacteroidota bacterium]|nr:hypothetical protein [Bacteroidota bacterium]
MKKIIFCFLITLGCSQLLTAQTTVDKTATPIGYSSNLSQGKITFTKTFVPGDGKQFNAVYTLAVNENPSINNGKKETVTLSRNALQDFFSTHPAIADKWNSVNKFITDNKISLTDEKGWVAAIQYFNNMQ